MRNMNNQKFTIKNLEFEHRKKMQELTDKMLKLDNMTKRQSLKMAKQD
jgi:hypothetical protein